MNSPAPDPKPAAKPARWRDNAPPDPARPTVFWQIMRALCRIVLTPLCEPKIFGAHHVPRQGGALIIGSHQSFLDPVLYGYTLQRPMSYLARDSLFRNRFFGWLIGNLHALPVKRGSGDAGAMKECLRRVQEGHLLQIYPEGTRSRDGEIGPILGGVAIIIKRATVPIIPAVVDGSFEAWRPGTRLPRPHPVWVMFGPPLQLEGLKAADIQVLIDKTFRAMLTELRAKRSAGYISPPTR